VRPVRTWNLAKLGASVVICPHNCARSASPATCASTSCSRSRIRIRARPAAWRFRNHCGVLLEPPMPVPTTRYRRCSRNTRPAPCAASRSGDRPRSTTAVAVCPCPGPDPAVGAPIQPHFVLVAACTAFLAAKFIARLLAPDHTSSANLESAGSPPSSWLARRSKGYHRSIWVSVRPSTAVVPNKDRTLRPAYLAEVARARLDRTEPFRRKYRGRRPGLPGEACQGHRVRRHVRPDHLPLLRLTTRLGAPSSTSACADRVKYRSH
jgi:hypothetical protein